MKLVSALLLVLGSCLVLVEAQNINWSKIKPNNIYVPGAGTNNGLSTHIVGGRIATRGQFPWQVALFMDNRGFCGGSLVTTSLVLTAAHCTYGFRTVLVVMGSHNLQEQFESSRDVLSSLRHAAHPKYRSDDPRVDFDLAYVRLPRSTTISAFIRPIRLPSIITTPLSYVGDRARVSGWGRVSDTTTAMSAVLKYADVTVIANSVCARTFGPAVNANKLCIATSGGDAPCNGDSGGPLVIQDIDRNFTLIGVVSFGSSRGCSIGAPGVFSRVTSYLNDQFLTSQLY